MVRFNKLNLIVALLIVCVSNIAIGEAHNTSNNNTDVQEQNQHHNDGKKHNHHIKKILIYKDSNCENWDQVKKELDKRSIEYYDIDLSWNRKQRLILERKAGKHDSSYVFIGNEYIGNHKNLLSILKAEQRKKELQSQ